MTEHYAGAFPTWLSPIQAEVIPVTSHFADYAHQVAQKLKAQGVRVEVDDRNEKVGYKIREAQLQKVPYMLIVGEREVENQTVGVRHRAKGDLGAVAIDEFIGDITKEIKERS